VAEAFFAGIFQRLEPDELAAVASAFTRAGKPGKLDMGNVTKTIVDALSDFDEISEVVKAKEEELALEASTTDQLSYNLCSVVLKWSHNCSFIEIMKLTDEKEGNLVRVMLMTADLLNTLENCAEIVGDEEFQKRCVVSASKIKRSIVFPNSLYLE
jgi:superfamily II RNA helicase